MQYKGICAHFGIFFVHIFVLSSYNCRVWPVWGVLKNALLFLQTTMDPFLVFLLVPLGSLEFRLAGVIVFLTLHDNQIYFEHLKNNHASLCTSVYPSLYPPQVSEAGVHRPHVGGIHGRSNDGSYSLVLAGGFEDEVVGPIMFLSPC